MHKINYMPTPAAGIGPSEKGLKPPSAPTETWAYFFFRFHSLER